jgi:hypothetical protein
MVGVRRTADSARGQVTNALADGRRRTGVPRLRAVEAPHAVLAMQRNVGNAAVSALMVAKFRSPSEEAVGEIDAALREIRQDEPAINTVEKGLMRVKAAGVPVVLEGPKPPPFARVLIRTGFSPVPAKKPVRRGNGLLLQSSTGTDVRDNASVVLDRKMTANAWNRRGTRLLDGCRAMTARAVTLGNDSP